MNVFTYGSLMYNSVWSRVVTGAYQKKSGLVQGFKRLQVKHEWYPGLIRGNGQVEGMVYFEVSAADLARLDRFEGAFYQREEVEIVCEDGESLQAYVYVIQDKFKGILNGEWSQSEFEKIGLREFEARYVGFNKV